MSREMQNSGNITKRICLKSILSFTKHKKSLIFLPSYRDHILVTYTGFEPMNACVKGM